VSLLSQSCHVADFSASAGRELVSVIVPSYNRADFVRRCYDSVVAQQHRPLEFIFADDASTDKTAEEVKALPLVPEVTIRYLRQPVNRGVSAARNLAARSAQGQFIAFLDSDDVWFPNHLEKLLSVMARTGADIVFSKGEIRESPEAPPSGRSDFGPQPKEAAQLAECLYYYNFVLPTVTMVRKRFFEQVGWFDEHPDIQHAEDWDIFLRAAQADLTFAHVPEATAYYIVPAHVAESKQQMMMRRFIFCQEKHRDYPLAPATGRRLTLGYYRVWLGRMLGAENTEAQHLFRRVWSDSWWHPLMGTSSLCGLLIPRLPTALRPYGHKLFGRLFARLRASHRRLRGFADSRG
jgi:glycosyltransferase involved in cell wall biosynthesis